MCQSLGPSGASAATSGALRDADLPRGLALALACEAPGGGEKACGPRAPSAASSKF